MGYFFRHRKACRPLVFQQMVTPTDFSPRSTSALSLDTSRAQAARSAARAL
jgi:hypothetical protein